MKILITTSGIGSRLGNITQYINKSLVKIGDKLAIDYIIDNYKHLPNVEFVITLGYKGDFVKQYLTLAYPKLINEIQFVDVNLYQGPGSSLGYSLLQTRTFINEPFIFHCCDAIFIDKINFNFNKNTLFVFKKDYAAQYSTVNVVDDYITQINEKGANIFDFMYVGVSYIKDYELFWNCLEKIYMQDKYFHQLSDIHVYMEMLKTIKFKFKILNKYFDIGNQNDYAIVLEHFKKKYNVLFVLDEIATGFGRLGSMIEYKKQNCHPDIVSFGKMLTGGYLTFAATLTTKKISNSFLGKFYESKHLFHGHTYTGNPIAASLALENLKLYDKMELIQKIQKTSKIFENRASEFYELDVVADVRHKGMLMGIELINNNSIKTRKSINKIVFEEGKKHDIFFRTLGNVVMLVPPLAISTTEINLLIDGTVKTINGVSKLLK